MEQLIALSLLWFLISFAGVGAACMVWNFLDYLQRPRKSHMRPKLPHEREPPQAQIMPKSKGALAESEED